jgi:hypothetical protein
VGTEWIVNDEREAMIEDLRKRARDFAIEREGINAFNEKKLPTSAAWGRDDEDGRPVIIDLGDLSGS